MKKKSQVREIKEGLSNRQKTYSGRTQPVAPRPQLPTKNSVKLASVPSTSKEKFNGGKDD